MSDHYEGKDTEYFHSEGSEQETALVPGQVVLAHIKQFDEQHRPIVCYMVAGKTYTAAALFTNPLGVDSVNRQVALTFLENNIQKPLILGVVYSPLYDYLTQVTLTADEVGDGLTCEQVTKPKQNRVSESGADKSQPSHELKEQQKSSSLLQEPVVVDGKKVKIEGADQVELRCGEASITLTNSGKILIRGKYLLNRASGVNRIVGGSVQVN